MRVKKMDKSFNVPSSFTVVYVVGWVTFREIVRDKVLYNILLCAFLLFGVGFLASRLMFMRQDRVVLDFGLSAVNISCAMIAIFTGAGLLGKEFERRTIFVALSRPISRLQFIFGKYAGLSAVLFLNWALLSVSFAWILWGSSVNREVVFSGALAWGLVLLFFQSLLLAGISILFSSISTTSLAVIISIGFYLIGNNISQMKLVATRMQPGLIQSTLNALASILPNLEHFNLGTTVTYGLPVSLSQGMIGILYSLTLALLFLLAGGFLIRWRES
jgi:ABC-type transport system involved in multi-copper enzyme maturation permease subunit